jgi:WD40 repeat protein
VVFSPDGRIIASGSQDKIVHLWDVQNQKELSVLKANTYSVREIVFSPDGRLLTSVGGGKNIRLWNTSASYEMYATLKGHK